MSKVLGVMGLKDEWPLCGVSISYALDNLVARMVVIDHGSGETTTRGLAHLQEIYRERLEVVRILTPRWHQRAVYELGLTILNPDPDDWIYIVDADEFLLLRDNETLLKILERQESDVISYQIENWLVPTSMDLANLTDYLAITTRALPNKGYPVSHSEMTELIELRANYFDYAFQPKVINRFRVGQWYTEGAHFLRNESTGQPDPGHPCDSLRVAHLPFASFNRLQLRIKRGLETIASGAPKDFAWQSQVVAHIFERGQIDDFWNSHSHSSSGVDGLHTEQTESFASALAPTLENLRRSFGPRLEVESIPNQPHYALEPNLATQILERFVHLQDVASGIRLSLETEILHITEAHRQELTSIRNSRAWKIGRRIQYFAQLIRRPRGQ